MTRLASIAAGLFAALLLVTASIAQDRWMSLPLPPPPDLPAPAQSGLADINGIKMYYAVYGEGEPILLIHGGLGYADIWAHQIIDLSKDHKVIVADSRGHGRSSRTTDPFGYHLMAEDYVALLDVLGIDRTALVGWSDGGIIGIDIALNHPERLTGLFAHAANVTVDGVIPTVAEAPVFAEYITRMGETYAKVSPTPTEYDAFLTQISEMWATQPAWTDAELGAITTPTAIVLGDHDEAISLAHTEHMAAVIPGSKLIILPEVSHFAMLQDPEGYTKAIRDFLAE